MRKTRYAALMVGLSLTLLSSAQAADELILGDSIGIGVKGASGHGGPAKGGLRIRSPQIINQINSVPWGTTAFLVLGTNDAQESLSGIERFIDRIVRAANMRSVKLIWIGPSCVAKKWDENIGALDVILANRLAPTTVQYVSMRGDNLCSQLDKDGVHPSAIGYQYIWKKASTALAGTVAPVGPVAAVPTPDPSPPTTPPQSGAVQQPTPPVVGTPQQPPSPSPVAVQPAPSPPSSTTPPPTPSVAEPPKPDPSAAAPRATPVVTPRRVTPVPRNERRPVVRIVVTPRAPVSVVTRVQVVGPIRVALGLGPDPYLEPPFPQRRR